MIWEYKVAVRNMLHETVEEMGPELNELTAGLDTLGALEWELVSVFQFHTCLVGWFKRPVTP